MNESKHTPGPWHYYVEDLRGGRYHCVSFGPSEWDGVDLHETENGEANARLIAAAPDLLEAILNSDDAHWTPAMRAAIAKVTGKEVNIARTSADANTAEG